MFEPKDVSCHPGGEDGILGGISSTCSARWGPLPVVSRPITPLIGGHNPIDIHIFFVGPLISVMTPFITSRGPSCRSVTYIFGWFMSCSSFCIARTDRVSQKKSLLALVIFGLVKKRGSDPSLLLTAELYCMIFKEPNKEVIV